MKNHHIASPATPFDFDAALKRATAVADEQLGENMLLSWYDRERDIESPAHVSECHEGCAIKGFWDYALNRGGALAVNFDEGRFVFCFMPLGDFARLV
ncbi:MAG: AF1514 family protein [Sideroxydans sp.]|nr:AF1514 family protein [Sideroxydans sp.]